MKVVAHIPTPTPESDEPMPTDGSDKPTIDAVLTETVSFIDRFMALTPEQLDAIALFIATTHCTDSFQVVPYLFVTSAEKRCGKTLLLDLIERLVLRGVATTNISPAALYRMVEQRHPTLLFDEADTIFATKGKGLDPAKADLVGLINAGFRRGRPTFRMGGPKMQTVEEFDPFCPKVLAGIGRCLPDTTEDRCVPVVIPRKARSTTKQRYRLRIHEPEAEALGERIAATLASLDLSGAWPSLPEELNDRQQDIWEPMLALADAAGGEWPDRARHASVALHHRSDPSESIGVKLLSDIRDVFTADRLLTKQLVALLNDLDESPWPGFAGGKGITSAWLVKRLKPFEISSKDLRMGTDRGKGFDLWQFADAFGRYLDDDSDDSDDNAEDSQVRPVIGTPKPTDDATDDKPSAPDVIGSVIGTESPTDDAPEQGKHPDVNGVTAVIGTPPAPSVCRVCGTECRPGVTVHPNCMEATDV